jgi:hypothetical protein
MQDPLGSRYRQRCRASTSSCIFDRPSVVRLFFEAIRYRVERRPSAIESAKIGPNGAAGTYLRALRVGDVLDVSLRAEPSRWGRKNAQSCCSALESGDAVLAMLYALAESKSTRQIFWRPSRDRQHHPFADEVRRSCSRSRKAQLCVLQPAGLGDRLREDFDGAGHLSRSVFEQIGVPIAADVYMCGPTSFMGDMKEVLAGRPRAGANPHQLFNGGESMMPGGRRSNATASSAGARYRHGQAGVVRAERHRRTGTGPHQSLLSWLRRAMFPCAGLAGLVSATTVKAVVSGAVVYGPEPLDQPAEGNLLVCCSQPTGDIVIDL